MMALLITGIVVGGLLWLYGKGKENQELHERKKHQDARRAERLRELTPWED